MLQRLFPFLYWLPSIKHTWKDDLIAGITGTIIVIPQAVAFAMIAGLPPIYGFYTAIITPIVAALFGSSYQLISGPTTGISLIIYSTISTLPGASDDISTFIGLTLVITFLAGVFQLLLGLAKMGKLVNFVSHSVIIGFTAGTGILIAFNQLKYIFDLPIAQGSTFIEITSYIIVNFASSNLLALSIAFATLTVAILVKLLIPKLGRYYLLLAMIVGSLLALQFSGSGHEVENVGLIPSQLPKMVLPDLSIDKLKLLSSGAMVIALLGLMQSVAAARSVSVYTKQRINNNQEFIGQGLSNIVGSMFSCYAGCGSFTRTSVNFKTGAKTPWAAIISALLLIVVLKLFASWATYLPKPAMGGLLLVVGYSLFDFKHIKRTIKSSRRESFILFSTLLSTLFFSLGTALAIGIIFSLFFYLERTSKPNIAVMGMDKRKRFINVIREENLELCPQLQVIRIDGSIYFGALEVVSKYIDKIYKNNPEKHLLIIANGINFIDLAGAEWLANESKKWEQRGGGIYLVGLKLISQDVLIKGGFIDKIGAEKFFKRKTEAVAHIFKKLDKEVCNSCTARIFNECRKLEEKSE
jgi:sulfate permease, SulP family